jgi:hypothetical protein
MSTRWLLPLLVVAVFSASAAGFGDAPLARGYILAAANGAGSHGSYWKTDVWIHNAGPESADVAFWFLPSGKAGAADSIADLRVSPGETLEISNVLGTLLRTPDPVGAIEFRVVSGPPIFIQSRTFATRGEEPPIPASASGEACSASEPGLLGPLRRGAVFRTNLSVVNPLPKGAEGTIELRDEEGKLVASQRFALEPRSYLGLSDLLAPLGRTREASATIIPDGDARLFSLASIISSETGEVETVLASPARRR